MSKELNFDQRAYVIWTVQDYDCGPQFWMFSNYDFTTWLLTSEVWNLVQIVYGIWTVYNFEFEFGIVKNYPGTKYIWANILTERSGCAARPLPGLKGGRAAAHWNPRWGRHLVAGRPEWMWRLSQLQSQGAWVPWFRIEWLRIECWCWSSS